MARWIEVGREALPGQLTIRVGDLLRFSASGGHVRAGAEVLQLLGPFIPAVVATDGRVLAPQAAPGILVFLARAPGAARVDVVTGDPWRAPVMTAIEIQIEP